MPIIAAAVSAIGAAIGSIGAAVGSFVASLGFLGKIALSIGLNVAMSLLNKQDVPKQQVGTKFERELGPDVSRYVACGIVGTAGHDIYLNTYYKSNKLAQQVLVLSDYPSDSLIRIAVNGVWKELEDTGDPAGLTIKESDDDDADNTWVGYLFVKFYDGRQTTATSQLKDNANPAARWSAQHVGLGITYLIVTAHYHETRASFPEVFVEFKGARLYDWRKDSTAGGSGSHRWDNPATHEFSENPIVMEYHYRRGFSVNGDTFCGMEMPQSDLPLDRYTAAANICDENDADGQDRYRCSIMLDCMSTHADNIEALMLSCGGMVVNAIDGAFPIVGSNQPIVREFSDDDLVAGADLNFRAKRSMADLVNSVSGTYPDRTKQWAMDGYKAQESAAAKALDRRTRDVNLNLPTVYHKRQAEQLASIVLKENRFEATAQITLRPAFQNLEPGDWLRWNSAMYGTMVWLVTEAEVGSLEEEGPRNIRLSLQQRDGEIYSGITADALITPVRPGAPVYDTELTNFAVTAAKIQGTNSRERAAILATWDAIDDLTIDRIVFRYWPTAQPAQKVQQVIDDTTATLTYLDGVISATQYSVQHKLIADPARNLPWSTVKTVTTVDSRLIGLDILDGAIAELQLASNAVSAAKIQLQAVTAAKIADLAVTVAKIADGAIIAGKLAASAVTQDKIAAGAVSIAKFASGLTPVEIVGSLPTTGNYAGRQVFLTTDGKTYRHKGTPTGSAGFTAAVASVDVSGQLTSAQIQSIEAAKLTGQVTASQITAGAITTEKIAAGAITAATIASGAITTTKLAAGAVTATTIAADAVTAGKIAAGAVSATEIAADAIKARHLAIGNFGSLIPDSALDDATVWNAYGPTPPTIVSFDGATNGKAWRIKGSAPSDSLNRLGVVNSKTFAVNAGQKYAVGGFIDPDSLNESSNPGTARFRVYWLASDGSQIDFETVYSRSLVSSSNLAWSAITTAPDGASSAYVQLARTANDTGVTREGNVDFHSFYLRPAVDAGVIVDGSIQASKIAAGAVEAGKIAAGAVEAGTIAAGAITSAKIAAGAVTAVSLAVGAVTANAIAANAITAVKIQAGAVTAEKMTVANLAAISATLGSVDIGDANIGTLTVGNANIANGAISDVVALSLGNTSGGGGWNSLGTVNFTATGTGNVIVTFTCFVGFGGTISGSTYEPQIRLLRDGTPVYTTPLLYLPEGFFVALAFTFIDTNTSGLRTYEIQSQTNNAGADIRTRNAKLVIMSLKK